MYDEIQLEEKKYNFLHSLPLATFKNEGIVLGADIIEKHQAYIIDVLDYCRDNCKYIIEPDQIDYHQGNHIIRKEYLQSEIANVLIIDPDTDEGIRENLIKNPDIAGLLKRVMRRNTYNEQRDFFLHDVRNITSKEREYLIEKLDNSNATLQRYELDKIDPVLDDIIDRMGEDGDRPDDYVYRQLRNRKHFKTIFTKEQQAKIFQKFAHYVNDDTLKIITGGDIVVNDYELLYEINKYRNREGS